MTNPFTHNFPAAEFKHRLSQSLAISPSDITSDSALQFAIPTLQIHFRVQWSASSSLGTIHQLVTNSSPSPADNLILLVTPFLSDGAKNLCAEHQISWFDLSGNAHIIAPNLRVIIEGKPNLYKEVGRPSNIFAPKSARVARWLLMHPNQVWKQKDIAQNTDMTEAFVSRIIKSLEEESYIEKSTSGIHLPNWSLLFNAWLDRYEFNKHTLIKGHIPARSTEQRIQSIHSALQNQGSQYALTGLAAAWRHTQFANFHLSTFFLSEYPSTPILDAIGFRQSNEGANTWFVIPNDEGVFQDTQITEGIPCVHPIQVCMDLTGHPERAKEVLEQLRQALQKEIDHVQ